VNRSQQRANGASDWAAEALQQLLEFLQTERDALIGANADLLAQTVQRKEQILRRLATELRSSDLPGLQETLRTVRDLNERNARLLLPRLRINQAKIDTLLGAARTRALYSANGRAAGADSRPQRGVRA
jgi:flagellar biosynthesis/type III secretory pathway chaperone